MNTCRKRKMEGKNKDFKSPSNLKVLWYKSDHIVRKKC